MKKRLLFSTVIMLSLTNILMYSQQNPFVHNLTQIKDSTKWKVYNRDVLWNSEVYLNGKPGDGLLIFNSFKFKNGIIDVDIKGKDTRGLSFVGIAFHVLDEKTYDAIYFRPFNFKSPERNGHSVQYIAHPEFTWEKLRNEHPGIYENLVSPLPDPNDWFHATIVVTFPEVKVFVNSSATPSLTVTQLSSRKEGYIGCWTGNNSDGYFKNLKITVK
jgi:hypothetical protein